MYKNDQMELSLHRERWEGVYRDTKNDNLRMDCPGYNPIAALARYKILETEYSAGKGLWPVGRLCPVIYEAEIRWNENRRTRMNQSSV